MSGFFSQTKYDFCVIHQSSELRLREILKFQKSLAKASLISFIAILNRQWVSDILVTRGGEWLCLRLPNTIMSTVGERAGGAAVIVSELSFFRLQPPLRDEFESSMPVPWNMAGRQIMHAYGSLRDPTCQ
jgi:hypothetical protein